MTDPKGPGELPRLHAATVAEHQKLVELKVIATAEELVATVRIVDLLESQVDARRRHAEAEIQLVKALKAGSRGTVAAGRRAAAAQSESERICGEGNEEIAQIAEAEADRFDLRIDQYSRWADAADAEFYAHLRAGP
jgi:hypothetical protein